MENKQECGLKKRDGTKNFDKFYTKKEIVKICIQDINNNIIINKDDLIIEPSAGNGSFIDSIKDLSSNNIFFDILPEHKDIIKQDFLEYNFNEIRERYNKIHIIGNPPFGRQSSTAIKFIKYCEFANSISFILPRSFKKYSMMKFFPKCFHLLKIVDLPDNSFIVNEIEHNVPCILQIWEKRDYNRILPKKINPNNNYEFVKKNENPDISFRRVGVYAGKIDTTIDKSEQSHYFIKFNKNINNVNDIIIKLNTINFETNNTVGPKSISKQEIIKEFNSKLTEKDNLNV